MVIYKITNKLNGKVYIGQTIQKFAVRKRLHKSEMNRNSNSYIHRAMRKYGWDNFEWDIIYECNNKDELDKKEIEFIEVYESHYLKGKGYNITKGGDYNIMSDPDKREMLVNRMKTNNPMFNTDIVDKVRKTNERTGRYKSEYYLNLKKETRGKYGDRWCITFPDGHTEEIQSLANFCRDNGLYRSCMCNVSKGKKTHHKGYKCFKIENIKEKE